MCIVNSTPIIQNNTQLSCPVLQMRSVLNPHNAVIELSEELSEEQFYNRLGTVLGGSRASSSDISGRISICRAYSQKNSSCRSGSSTNVGEQFSKSRLLYQNNIRRVGASSRTVLVELGRLQQQSCSRRAGSSSRTVIVELFLLLLLLRDVAIY